MKDPVVRRSVAGWLGGLLLLAMAACSAEEPLGGEQPKTEIFVLVDLSETWHDKANPEVVAKNQGLLRTIGHGIALHADAAEPPVLVQYRVIGSDSLNREPICRATYMPTLVGGGSKDSYRIRSRKKLEKYLSLDCPRVVMARPPELRTEISAAIASVAEKPRGKNAARYMIIASDFLEETNAPEPLPPAALAGTRVLLLYRPVTPDRQVGGMMKARIVAWRRSLEHVGAVVSLAPDSGYEQSDLVGFLGGK